MAGPSFVRVKPPGKVSIPGTKPGHHGQALVSTGVQELDQCLGGGLQLGTLTLLLGDSWGLQVQELLLKHMMAQGVAHAHPLLYASTHPLPGEFLASSPAVSEAKDDKKEREMPLTSGTQEGQSGLRIAWQYQRYLDEQKALEERRIRQREAQASTSTASADEAIPAVHSSFSRPTIRSSFLPSRKAEAPCSVDFCSSFDIRKAMGNEVLRVPSVHCHSITDLEGLHTRCWKFLETLRPDRETGRIVIHGLGQVPWMESSEGWQHLALLRFIKGLTRTHPTAIAIVTLPLGSPPHSFLMRAQHLADCVLETQSVDEDDRELAAMFPEYGEIQGLLHVQKVALLNTQVPFIPEATSMAVRVVRRRRLTLEKLHIAPALDDEVQQEVGTSGRKAASGLACAGPKNAPSVLDF